MFERSAGQGSESKERVERVMAAVREIDPGAQGRLEDYVTVNFEDAQGRWVEARLLSSRDDSTSFVLNANVGKPLALIELKERLAEKGIRVARLVAFEATEEERRQLEAASGTL